MKNAISVFIEVRTCSPGFLASSNLTWQRKIIHLQQNVPLKFY